MCHWPHPTISPSLWTGLQSFWMASIFYWHTGTCACVNSLQVMLDDFTSVEWKEVGAPQVNNGSCMTTKGIRAYGLWWKSSLASLSSHLEYLDDSSSLESMETITVCSPSSVQQWIRIISRCVRTSRLVCMAFSHPCQGHSTRLSWQASYQSWLTPQHPQYFAHTLISTFLQQPSSQPDPDHANLWAHDMSVSV